MVDHQKSQAIVQAMGCCGNILDGGSHICILDAGHEPTMQCPVVVRIAGFTQAEMHQAIETGDTKIAFAVLSAVSKYSG